MKKIKKYLLFWLLFLVILPCFVRAEEMEEPGTLYARSAVLMDADSGRILFDKNGEEKLANASTTKILTCILALEKASRSSKLFFRRRRQNSRRSIWGRQKARIFIWGISSIP